MVQPLLRAIPPGLVRFFARPYVAGDTLGSAMDAAAELLAETGCLTTLDLLAEGIDSSAVVERNLNTYYEMINAAAGDDRFASPEVRPTVSLKPSSYTTSPLDKGGTANGSRDAIYKICDHARDRNVQVTVDMENSAWTDWTLELMNDLHADGFTNTGTVIQTRLHRTRQDLERLPAGCRVRVVIGIYKEPATIAIQDRKEMKDLLLEFSKILLDRGHYVELATHDDEYVKRFVDEWVPEAGVGRDRFEVQMLYGVPRADLQRDLIERGVRVRLYVPFAEGWPMAIAYLRRRLDEYPAMMFTVLGDVLRR
jgi:proline dehydrogenase